MKTKKIEASDKKCVECGKQAVCFWPLVDPDIPASAYCYDCLGTVQLKLMMELDKIDRKYNN